jgi:hypothetical protein
MKFRLYTLDHDGHNYVRTMDDWLTAFEVAVLMASKSDGMRYNREVVAFLADDEGKEIKREGRPVRFFTINAEGAKRFLTDFVS